MFITEKIIAAFNGQITQEFSNYLQYVAVANWFAGQDLKLLAKHYYKQADEERDHAMRFTNFLIDCGAEPQIQAIPAQHGTFANATEAAQLAYDAEVRTTKQIHALLDLAVAEKCPPAQQFLQWFVAEQVEEIATAQTFLNVIKKSGNNIFMVEAYLAHGD
jgi:ferritin